MSDIEGATPEALDFIKMCIKKDVKERYSAK